MTSNILALLIGAETREHEFVCPSKGLVLSFLSSSTRPCLEMEKAVVGMILAGRVAEQV